MVDAEGAWLRVAESSDLTVVGQTLFFEFEGQSLFLWKDGVGVSCYYNVCRHRNCKLIDDSSLGHWPVTTVIECPFHRWIYTLDGKGKNGAPPLFSLPVLVQNGQIYVRITQ